MGCKVDEHSEWDFGFERWAFLGESYTYKTTFLISERTNMDVLDA